MLSHDNEDIQGDVQVFIEYEDAEPRGVGRK
jgi:hypothetical protein